MPLRYQGFKAWIECDGTTLKEYAIDVDEDANTISCFIPSVAGKRFSVSWWEREPQIASSGHVYIDGNDVASAIIRQGRQLKVERSGVKEKHDLIRPFTFSRLALTDDENVALPEDPAVLDIGTIEIRIRRVEVGEAVEFEGYEAPEQGPVHEKAKKAGSHHTSFGPLKKNKKVKSKGITTKIIDLEDPGIRFIFRYRSLDVLQAQGIAPPPPNSQQSDDDDEVIDDDITLRPSQTENGSAEPSQPPQHSRKRVRSTNSGQNFASGDEDEDGDDNVPPSSQDRKKRKPLFQDSDEEEGPSDEEDGGGAPKTDKGAGEDEEQAQDEPMQDADD